MQIYLDTEFTDLSDAGELISVGAITEDGQEFYAELLPYSPWRCSQFVMERVLPLLDGGAALCYRDDLPAKFGEWLSQFEAPSILVDSDLDIYMLRRALTGEASRDSGVLGLPELGIAQVPLRLLPVLDEDAQEVFSDARIAIYLDDNRRHHALVDTRALRAGCRAVVQLHSSSSVAASSCKGEGRPAANNLALGSL